MGGWESSASFFFSDPYVKIWLMFGEKRVEKKKTPVYSCNLNPKFNQVRERSSIMPARLGDLQGLMQGRGRGVYTEMLTPGT